MKKGLSNLKKTKKREKKDKSNSSRESKDKKDWQLKETLRESTQLESREIGLEEVTVTQVQGKN